VLLHAKRRYKLLFLTSETPQRGQEINIDTSHKMHFCLLRETARWELKVTALDKDNSSTRAHASCCQMKGMRVCVFLSVTFLSVPWFSPPAAYGPCSSPGSDATWRPWNGPSGVSEYRSWTTGGRRVGPPKPPPPNITDTSNSALTIRAPFIRNGGFAYETQNVGRERIRDGGTVAP